MAYYPHRKTDDIYHIVAGRQPEILTALGIGWNPARPNQHIRCPYPSHTDAHPSWRWDHNKGIAHCTCGHADIFGVVMKVKGYGSGKEAFRKAADYCRDVLGAERWQEKQEEKRRLPLHIVPDEAQPEVEVLTPDEFQRAPEAFPKPTPDVPGYTRDTIPRAGVRREHVYCRAGVPILIKQRMANENPKFLPWYRIEGNLWQNRKPDGFHCLPYVAEGCNPFVAHPNRPLFWCEGERDVDSVAGCELDAFTFGSALWVPSGSEQYTNGRVVVIPTDNDETGEADAQKKAERCLGIAASIKVLKFTGLAEHGDISDWLQSHSVHDLHNLIAATPEWKTPSDTPSVDAAPEWKVPGDTSSADSWPIMDDAAYYGLAGEVTKTIAPHSEADPVAIHIQFLVYFGNAVGSCPYYQIESDRHHANLFAVLTGISSRGRKGTSGGRVRAVMEVADEEWTRERMKGGLSSGEGFINEVRDEVKKYDAKAKQFEVIDPGVADKRLMITEAEFGNALAVMERPGNTLSPTIRKAWDGHTLSTLTKNSPLKATGAHISISGHITEDELRAGITRTDMANGFANRFLFVCVRRSQLLPHGGSLREEAIRDLGTRTAAALDVAKKTGQMRMSDAARQVWEEAYKSLSADQRGLLGAITARAEAQVIRLAMVYALLDGVIEISVAHLTAATAVWEYCEASAARIFGNALGDPVADEILLALRQAGATGMTRTAIRDLFGRHRSGDRIGAALALLMTKGRARAEVRTTGGRPSEVWFAKGEV